jgi:predicted Rossmann fold nucleotide-binding protein DprA/Smf involved in DNA uptake
MSESHRHFAMQLALTSGIGGKSVQRILVRSDLKGHTPKEFFKLSVEALCEDYGLNRKAAQSIAGSTSEKRAEIEKFTDRIEKLGVSIATTADAHYPSRLERFDPDPPALLFLFGNTKLLEARTFSVLCSNGAPPEALDKIERLAEEGVLNAEALVSGVNRAPYQRAAVVPLRWGSPRILCLDRGLLPTLGETLSEEPFPAARLWRYKFDPQTDLVVSPARPQSGFRGVSNQVRDRLVAGLSDRMDFAYVRPGGQMEKLLRMAISAGLPVRVLSNCPEVKAYEEIGASVVAS